MNPHDLHQSREELCLESWAYYPRGSAAIRSTEATPQRSAWMPISYLSDYQCYMIRRLLPCGTTVSRRTRDQTTEKDGLTLQRDSTGQRKRNARLTSGKDPARRHRTY